MGELFNFGISQEDVRVLDQALELKKGDRLLCIASAGEVPLGLLALKDIKIDAVDISQNQLFLSKLKLHSACSLDPHEAAAFLGYTESQPEERKHYFSKVSELMGSQEKLFWQGNMEAIEKGAIRTARFEKYLSKFSRIGLLILGRKKLMGLFKQDNIESQQDYFDRHLSTPLLKAVFKVAFHPKIYKKRGMDPDGLTHCGPGSMAEFFYSRFRDFCSSTEARKNYFFQFTFFSQVLFSEAWPEYLSEDGMRRIRANQDKLKFLHMSLTYRLRQAKKGEFNKFHLSNIGDWMSEEDYAGVLRAIQEKSESFSRIISYYIHYKHPIPDGLSNYLSPDNRLGESLIKVDRYPFYNLVPIRVNKNRAEKEIISDVFRH